MTKLLLIALLFLATSQAGVLSLATYPVRHPLRFQKKTAKVIVFPIVHPVRFLR